MPERQLHTIRLAIPRTCPWLSHLLTILHLQSPDSLPTIAEHLLTVAVAQSGRAYIQGMDRYFRFCFALCLCFSDTVGLGQEWTEVISFTNMSRLLSNFHLIDHNFTVIQKEHYRIALA
jgi:hypothetical protein